MEKQEKEDMREHGEKIQITKENLNLEETFPLGISRYALRRGEFPEGIFHYHDACEITYVESGSGLYFVNGERYDVQAGDLIIFNQVEAHGLQEIREDMNVLVLVFAPSVVSGVGQLYREENLLPFTDRGSDFQNMISASDSNTVTIYHLLLEVYRECTQKERGYRSMVQADVVKILTCLMRYYDRTNGITDTISDKKQNMLRLEKVFFHVNAHYTKQLTLEEAAGIACMSTSYFSSYFKKMTGQTFSEYVTRLRLEKAKKLLGTTDMKTADVAMECGFLSMSNFYRLYKKYMGDLPAPANKKVR